MYLNGFSVRVSPGREENGYVVMKHGDRYRLTLRNNGLKRCDARVEIDGQHVGTWRIEKNGSISLGRPAHDDGHFTFYKLGSKEAVQANLVPSSNLGLVKVVFTPELQITQEIHWPVHTTISYPASEAPSPCLCNEFSVDSSTGGSSGGGTGMSSVSHSQGKAPGGTGLSGHSCQQFGAADPLTLDYSRQTTIHLRLVVDGDEVRPLTAYSTPVPPPVMG